MVQGIEIMVTTKTVTKRGTDVSVCSCTPVNVCSRLTSKLTTHALINSGALNNIASSNTFRIISTDRSGPIATPSLKTLDQLICQ